MPSEGTPPLPAASSRTSNSPVPSSVADARSFFVSRPIRFAPECIGVRANSSKAGPRTSWCCFLTRSNLPSFAQSNSRPFGSPACLGSPSSGAAILLLAPFSGPSAAHSNFCFGGVFSARIFPGGRTSWPFLDCPAFPTFCSAPSSNTGEVESPGRGAITPAQRPPDKLSLRALFTSHEFHRLPNPQSRVLGVASLPQPGLLGGREQARLWQVQ